MRPLQSRARRGMIPSFVAGFAAALVITSLWRSDPTPVNPEIALRGRSMAGSKSQQLDHKADLGRRRKQVLAVIGVQVQI